MKLHFVRHGQTESQNPYQIFGRNEIPLSQKGVSEMKRLSNIDCEVIFCSPLERALKSAESISQERIPIKKDKGLLEIDFGTYSKNDVRELTAIFPNKYYSTLSPNEAFPQGESLCELAERIKQFHASLLEKKYSSVCIVSHQWALNTYLKILLHIPLSEKNNFIFEHGAHTCVEITNGTVLVTGHNIQASSELNSTVVRDEFNRRARIRQGIDSVLTDRYHPDINKQFNANITHLLNTNCTGPFASVLEVGVGIGRLVEFFKEKSRAILGIDFSEEMLGRAKKQFQDAKNVTLVHDDAATINLEMARFDLGVASLVLKHNSDENAKKILEKLKRHCDSILCIEHVRGGALGSSIAQIRDEQWYLDALSPFTITMHHHFLRGDDNMIFVIAKQ